MSRTHLAVLVAAVATLPAAFPLAAEPPSPAAWPRPPSSVVFGPLSAPTGGDLTVGILVPTPPSRRLVDLVPPHVLAAFEAIDRLRPVAPVPAPVEEIVEIDVAELEAWAQEAALVREALDETAAQVRAATGVRVAFLDLLACDAPFVPLVVVRGRVAHAQDAAFLATAVAGGTRVLCSEPPGDGVGEHVPGVFPYTAAGVGPLVEACLRTVRTTSPLVARCPEDPFEVLGARREAEAGAGAVTPGPALPSRGDWVVVRLRLAPDEATLRDLEDRVVATAERLSDGTVRVRCPDPGLDPRRHRLVVEKAWGGARLRRAWRVADLVGTPNRRVFAPGAAEAGAPYAPRVVVADARTGAPVEGWPVTVALRRGEAVLAQASALTDATGCLPVALAVPEEAPEGAADLWVGDDRFPVTVRHGLRLSVVTDRALYRTTDEVHARVMAHRAGSGRPVEGVEVALKLGSVEKTARTSAHGIASASFRLFEARPGPSAVEARARGVTASAAFAVRAFELPTFTLAVEPASVRARPGETVPVAVTATYTNGPPVLGARVDASASDGLHLVGDAGRTDEHGRCEVAVVLEEGAGDGQVRFSVQDADGRSQQASVPVAVDRGPSEPPVVVEPLEDPVVGWPCRLEVRSEGAARVEVSLPGEATRAVDLDASGRAVVAWTPRLVETPVGVRRGARERTAEVAAVERRPDRPLPALDRRVARVGESLGVTVLGPDGVAFVDLARDGTTLSAHAVEVRGGVGRLSLPLGEGHAGLLAVRAWRLVEGRPAGAAVPVLVVRGRSLTVTARADRAAYRPADLASVDVQIADRQGRPVAGVLGYWGVDEALLALAPWAPALEPVFDGLPPGAREDGLALAATAEAGREVRFVPARTALGPARFFDDLEGELPVRHDQAVSADAQVGAQTRAVAIARVEALRAAVVAAVDATPLEEARTAGSVHEGLRVLVEAGRLDPSLLLDPWGTPWAVSRGPAHLREALDARDDAWTWYTGHLLASPGPDLVPRTADDQRRIWHPPEPWELSGRVGRFLRFYERVLDASGTRPPPLAWEVGPFLGPPWNGLIGIGGGVGGAFRGRGGGRSGRMSSDGHAAQAPVHVRRDFAPTLCFVPEAVVGPDGRARLEIDLKDAVTTWRLRLVASGADGATGVGEARLRVAQPLHAEPWVATHLTVGDDLEVPVAVRNETDEATEVALSLSVSREIEVVGAATAAVRVAPRGTGAHAFRVRAVAPGSARVRVDAQSPSERDAVERVVAVRPFARDRVETRTGVVGPDQPWSAALPPPPDDAPTEHRLSFYPSALADTLGSFEGLIQCPHG